MAKMSCGVGEQPINNDFESHGLAQFEKADQVSFWNGLPAKVQFVLFIFMKFPADVTGNDVYVHFFDTLQAFLSVIRLKPPVVDFAAEEGDGR